MPAKRLRAPRKASLTSKLARVAPKQQAALQKASLQKASLQKAALLKADQSQWMLPNQALSRSTCTSISTPDGVVTPTGHQDAAYGQQAQHRATMPPAHTSSPSVLLSEVSQAPCMHLDTKVGG
eukprot:545917-Pelagomonas_calceolata.AAC.4